MPFMCKTGYESGVRPPDFHLACTAGSVSDRTSQVKVSHFEVRLRPDTNPGVRPPLIFTWLVQPDLCPTVQVK